MVVCFTTTSLIQPLMDTQDDMRLHMRQAKTQISLLIRAVYIESLWVAKEPKRLKADSDPRVFAGRTCRLVAETMWYMYGPLYSL